MDKNLYIGDFRVKNCKPYGAIGIIKQLKESDVLVLQYDVSEKLIVVKAKTKIEVKDDTTGVSKTEEKWITIGELGIPGCIRTVLVPLLLGRHCNDLFDCHILQINRNQPINNQLSLSVWAKK